VRVALPGAPNVPVAALRLFSVFRAIDISVDRSTDVSATSYQSVRQEFWNTRSTPHRKSARPYHRRLAAVYASLIGPGQRVLELGCGTGDLLASLQPSFGVGVDFSDATINTASARHPELSFVAADAHSFEIDAEFDVIILSDLVNDLWDVQGVLERVRGMCAPETRVILNFFNRLWQGPLHFARWLGLARPLLRQNWLSTQDMYNLLGLAGFEVVTHRREALMPAPLGPLSTLMNRYAVNFWPFSKVALTSFLVARPFGTPPLKPEASVSVIVPARNESGNIEAIIERTPQMGSKTEVIFVEGNSTDDTHLVIQRALTSPGREHVSLLRQPGVGKGDAVRHGFAHATGDILMILDADMTVAPEELPRFYRAITEGTGEFINGVRLVYPMEREAMRTLNFLGNKAFSIAFSWLLRQPVKDTLCGTKVLTRRSYEVIAANRSYFGDFDPFGDFDLLFGAAHANLKIVDLPIRYRDRTYGTTNIDRWRHGILLLRMSAFAARKLRFT